MGTDPRQAQFNEWLEILLKQHAGGSEYETLTELAQETGIGESTLRRWHGEALQDGSGCVLKHGEGGKLLFSRIGFRLWLAKAKGGLHAKT